MERPVPHLAFSSFVAHFLPSLVGSGCSKSCVLARVGCFTIFPSWIGEEILHQRAAFRLYSSWCAGQVRDWSLYSGLRAEKLFFGVKLSVPGTCRAEDVAEYFKRGEASPEGIFKSVRTFQAVVATGRKI